MLRMHSIGQFGFISCHKNVILFFMFVIYISSSSAYLNDYPEIMMSEPEMIHEPAGAFIKLKCELHPCHKNISLKWEFKGCGPDFLDKPKCRNSENNSWTTLQESRKLDHCTFMYSVKKSTGNNSGLYRCSYKQPDNAELKILKMFQIYVVEPYHIRNGEKPTILDIQPVNISVPENLKVVVQCKVYSDFIIHPEIWWLKHVDFTTMYSRNSIIQDPHHNKTYLKLESSQMFLANNTYVSKLIIKKSNENDTGMYSCVAVNFFGKSNKDVYIDVIPMEKNWQGTTSFLILFLIPVGFALIPISGLLCVHYYRKKKLQTEIKSKSEIYKYQPMLNRHNLNRHNRILNSTSQRIV